MANRYIVTEAARQEVTETFGEAFAVSVLEVVDDTIAIRYFAPVGDKATRIPLFSDQVEEAP